MSIRHYTVEEEDLIQERFAAKDDIEAIWIAVNALPLNANDRRTYAGICKKLHTLGLFRAPTIVPKQEPAREQQSEPFAVRAVRGDKAFKQAMLSAIKSGGEKAIIGTFKDRRPCVVRPIFVEPIVSGCGSSAYQCSEAGSSIGTRSRPKMYA